MWHHDSQAEIERIVAFHGTPIYIYSLDELRRKVGAIQAAFGTNRFSLLFATMANIEARILQTLANANVGACVNSLSHLEAAFAAGMQPSKIHYTSTSIPPKDMARIAKTKVRVNLDSMRQVIAWLACTDAKKVGIRLNAGSLAGSLEGDRIGVDVPLVDQLRRATLDAGGSIVGLHVYIGTNIHVADQMVPTVERLLQVARTLPTLEYLNIGGGMGVAYRDEDPEFDLARYGAYVRGAFDSVCDYMGEDLWLFFEPGRGLSAGSGIFVTSVTDVKILRTRRYVGTDASIATFPRPFHYPDCPHRVCLLGNTSKGPLVESVVVGQTTFSRDILAQCLLPRDIGVGDLLLFDNAGAYSASMQSRFLGQPEPKTAFMEAP